MKRWGWLQLRTIQVICCTKNKKLHKQKFKYKVRYCTTLLELGPWLNTKQFDLSKINNLKFFFYVFLSNSNQAYNQINTKLSNEEIYHMEAILLKAILHMFIIIPITPSQSFRNTINKLSNMTINTPHRHRRYLDQVYYNRYPLQREAQSVWWDIWLMKKRWSLFLVTF